MPGDRIEHGAVIPASSTPHCERWDWRSSPNRTSSPNAATSTSPRWIDDDLDDLWRCASLLDAGIAVGAGTDAPFGRPDPWALITAAVDRRTPAGTILNPAERIAADGARWRCCSADPTHPADRSGAWPSGQPSDLCLLTAPLRRCTRRSAACNPVRAVLRAGRLAYGDDGA